ncbi:ribonuclease J [Paenibacillus larvae]|uniref:Ribonuclease J n=4 Tax=Paenibacillus larvae TaxID=1464 RepID=V9W7K6_9BACL|nr:ribonuclease J [Paenibacillus larvae]AHD05899.1 ribonuclease J 1 [Paenibacillus larvae subsp. larvae DSM 25430]AQR76653.1 ribonuclease J [Paenibacillus larvae subsp. larvae]AQT83612.1 ribonuclease J [Paenibacillus larvae subsp. pulvifaciens]AQZ48729.1 ribonuclease J [Paenibacillus larvae subsp. pulvifaciens]ARF69967.1 ribonuclease J [Paenibacillus larvae subsp. pulvifaciens]
MSKKNNEKLTIFALGGVGEIGKNMYVVQYDNDIVVIDSGLKFPEEDMLGIDIVIPDISYLLENKDKVRGILITHGHEDHIGGLPYVLKHLNVPVYGTKLTLGLIETKLKEAGLLGETKRILINADSEIKMGTMTATFFKTNHSIPDSVGVCLETPEGNVVHTGDFKFDQTPVNDQYADLHRMAEIGKKGVLALLSDSTNAERPGYTGSEKSVGITIEEVFRKARQRVVLATFASNIHRVQQVIDAAYATNRKLTVIGRSMVNVVTIASELGYLRVPDGILIEPEEVNRLAADRVVILCTGSQGEPMSALTRMARSTHRKVDILPGDTVVIAATPIPGNERYVGRTVDELFRLGAHVIYGPGSVTGVHVSGHGSQEELKLMLNLMKPKYFIPIHGEYRMLRLHGQLAESVGMDKEDIFIIDNGDTVEIQNGVARKAGKVQAGNILIDGLGVGDVGNIVLRDRKLLSQDGILVVVVTLSKQEGTILSGPDIISRGFVYVRESEGLLDEANRIVTNTLNKLMNDNVNEWASLKTHVKDALGRFLYEQTRRRPMILPIIMEV